MSEFLAEACLGKMPLVSTNKLFKSPSGLIFECCGVARAVLVIIDKIEVLIDFHIYAILEFDIFIGYPLENLIQEKPSHGSLDESVGKTAFATRTSCPVNPMAKQHLTHDPFEEVKFVSPFISPKLAYEIERIPSPSLKPKPCPFGHLDVVLDNGRDSMLILHDMFLKNDNFCGMDMLLSTRCFHEDDNLLLILICKLFKRMVVDAFVYDKFCKSRSSTVVLTLQLEH